SIEELMIDLNAVKNGQPPMVAKDKFTLEGLEEIESEGIDVDLENDEELNDEIERIVTKYRVIMIIMSAAIAILVIMVGYLSMTK
ncbi:MAG: hypothetical protein K9M75_10655, partial [Phycisphaerae bacterium]|nr:hypothetical protein [Phycisphaerae bacterium]